MANAHARDGANIGYYDLKSGSWRPASASEQSAALSARELRRKQARNDFLKSAALSTAAVVGGGYGLSALTSAAPAAASGGGVLAGPGAVNTGVWTASAGAAPGAASMGIPWLGIGSKVADTLFGIYGSRKADKADQRALDYTRTRDAEALAYDRELEATRRQEFAQQQAEMKRQWDAQQKFEADKWAAMEEERLHNRALADAKETRQAPYRQASLAALNNLPALWASGTTSPGLGSLGSYRGGK